MISFLYVEIILYMQTSEIIRYWHQGSKEDWKVAQGLFKLKHYSHCLFFCHLATEKMLKALVVTRKETHAPYIHDLVVLCKKADLELTKQHQSDLETITSFNIQGRYADYKSQFYKFFNKRPAAQKYLAITQELLLWLENELNKK